MAHRKPVSVAATLWSLFEKGSTHHNVRNVLSVWQGGFDVRLVLSLRAKGEGMQRCPSLAV